MVKPTVIVEFSSVPIGTGDTSVSGYVAEALRVLEEFKDLRHVTTPMATIVEGGDLKRILQAIVRAHEALFEAGAKRVSTTIKIDDRRDISRKMEDKVRSVKEKL